MSILSTSPRCMKNGKHKRDTNKNSFESGQEALLHYSPPFPGLLLYKCATCCTTMHHHRLKNKWAVGPVFTSDCSCTLTYTCMRRKYDPNRLSPSSVQHSSHVLEAGRTNLFTGNRLHVVIES